MAALCRHVVQETILLQTRTHSFSFIASKLKINRFLFSQAALGVDNYGRIRERTNQQFASLKEKFKTKMAQYAEPNSTNMIFTEDLKNMIHLIEGSPEDMTLIYKMMKRFNSQNKEVRFGSFVFGPVVMRMYHFFNKPKEALEAFKDPELEGFFSQLSTYQVLMDLLFRNEMYKEVLEVADIVQSRQHQDTKYPKNVVILAFAACYKLNTEEAFKYATELWKNLKEVGHSPMRRAVTFAAALAINQNSPHIALEMVSSILQQNYVTVRNIKIAALADIGRPEDAVPILRNLIEQDTPNPRKQTVCEDVILKVKQSVEKSNNKELSHEFEQLVKRLSEGQHVTEKSLDEHLCAEIQETTAVNPQTQARNRRFIAASFNRTGAPPRRETYRPGLKDLY